MGISGGSQIISSLALKQLFSICTFCEASVFQPHALTIMESFVSCGGGEHSSSFCICQILIALIMAMQRPYIPDCTASALDCCGLLFEFRECFINKSKSKYRGRWCFMSFSCLSQKNILYILVKGLIQDQFRLLGRRKFFFSFSFFVTQTAKRINPF